MMDVLLALVVSKGEMGAPAALAASSQGRGTLVRRPVTSGLEVKYFHWDFDQGEYEFFFRLHLSSCLSLSRLRALAPSGGD